MDDGETSALLVVIHAIPVRGEAAYPSSLLGSHGAKSAFNKLCISIKVHFPQVMSRQRRSALTSKADAFKMRACWLCQTHPCKKLAACRARSAQAQQHKTALFGNLSFAVTGYYLSAHHRWD